MVVDSPELELRDLTKIFDNDVVAVDRVNLAVSKGELVTLLGPSGCGKTTTLRMIAGFIKPSSGDILIRGRRVNDEPPNRRNCGFVFQNYALFPHMTVAENIGYGLKIRKIPKDEIQRRVEEVARIVHLEDLLHRFPRQLSGGQQQRVALARAMAINPNLLLLDEPLSNLDAKLREQVRFELRNVQKTVQITTIFVTHDQAEAMVLSDRIVVMNQGRVEQIGHPLEIYHRPQTLFVADFIGQNNFIPARVKAFAPESKEMIVILDNGWEVKAIYQEGYGVGAEVVACIRPEAIQVWPKRPLQETWDNLFETEVIVAAFLGSEYRYEMVRTNEDRIKVASPRGGINSGDRVWIGWSRESVRLLPPVAST